MKQETQKYNNTIRSFRAWQKRHPNFMTPEVIKVKKSNNYRFVELSEGMGFEQNTIYGVTVINYNPQIETFESDHESKLNRCFSNLKEAQDHFKRC